MATTMTGTDPTTLRRQGRPIAQALNTIAAGGVPSFTMQTEEGRFRIQKAVYLLRQLGYPSAQKFDYNLYLMGPYSPELSRCYYALEDEGLAAAGTTKDLREEKLQILRAALLRDHDFLEGLTTLLDVNRTMHHLPAALAHAKAIKRHLGEKTWEEVRAFLATHRGLIGAT
jgi:uncharacterized protein YwgA